MQRKGVRPGVRPGAEDELSEVQRTAATGTTLTREDMKRGGITGTDSPFPAAGQTQNIATDVR